MGGTLIYWEKEARVRHPIFREKEEIETETQIKDSALDGKKCSWSSMRGVEATRCVKGFVKSKLRETSLLALLF